MAILAAWLTFPLGGSGDAPVAVNFSPTVGNTVGFDQAIQFDILDTNLPPGDLAGVIILCDFGFFDEVVHSGIAFEFDYAQFSTRTPIPGGFHYSLLRTPPGWWGNVRLTILAFDGNGHQLAPQQYYWPTPTPFQYVHLDPETRGEKTPKILSDLASVAAMLGAGSRAGR